MRDIRGISLLELVIILALVMIAAAVTIPRLLQSRVYAGETSAIVSLSILNQAERDYARLFPGIGFAPHLANLRTPQAGCSGDPKPSEACLIHFALAQADVREFNGYSFELTTDSPLPYRRYLAVAAPYRYPQTGSRVFCTMEDQILRGADAASAPAFRAVTRAECAQFTPLP
jgi:type II secretory pathway pseudopilin PulG